VPRLFHHRFVVRYRWRFLVRLFYRCTVSRCYVYVLLLFTTFTLFCVRCCRFCFWVFCFTSLRWVAACLPACLRSAFLLPLRAFLLFYRCRLLRLPGLPFRDVAACRSVWLRCVWFPTCRSARYTFYRSLRWTFRLFCSRSYTVTVVLRSSRSVHSRLFYRSFVRSRSYVCLPFALFVLPLPRMPPFTFGFVFVLPFYHLHRYLALPFAFTFTVLTCRLRSFYVRSTWRCLHVCTYHDYTLPHVPRSLFVLLLRSVRYVLRCSTCSTVWVPRYLGLRSRCSPPRYTVLRCCSYVAVYVLMFITFTLLQFPVSLFPTTTVRCSFTWVLPFPPAWVHRYVHRLHLRCVHYYLRAVPLRCRCRYGTTLFVLRLFYRFATRLRCSGVFPCVLHLIPAI